MCEITFAGPLFTKTKMDLNHLKNISGFFVAGINYKKSDACVRGEYAINPDQYTSILQKAGSIGLNELFVLSTCNRTEIYGFAANSEQLIQLLCSETAGDAEGFKKAAYVKSGQQAIEHLFHVGAGLDSQILGDYEIVGQLKNAVKFSKDRGFIGAFTERLINSVLQASKNIKNQTKLSGGTVSVSFAAIQYIKEKVANAGTKNILLLGVGKIGNNTCKNLVDYLNTTNITLVNRTAEKAESLAEELGLRSAPVEQIGHEICKADIIIVATNCSEPIIRKSHLEGGSEKLIIDLSIPYNVEAGAQELPNIELVNVDHLSKLKDETLRKREAEIPRARKIIAEVMIEFFEWYEMRKHVPLLKNLKNKLRELSIPVMHTECPRTIDVEIQRVLNDTAGKIKLNNRGGCQYISALHEFISAKN